MDGINVHVSNVIPPRPACCTEPGCKHQAQRLWIGKYWICNWHLYRKLRDLEAA